MNEIVAPRITRDQMFIEIARTVGKRGTCDRARVGAVLVDHNNNIISIGYNGSPAGTPHCDDVGHLMHHGHCLRTAHAEENCIDRATRIIEGNKYTMYVTHYPCIKCQAKLYEWCMTGGIQLLVIYDQKYGTATAFELIHDVSAVLQFSQFNS